MFYRLRQAFHYARFRHKTGIGFSRPVACSPQAACAIHTMLGKRDLPLYLAAIKSFLRFHSEVAVLIHSDGTLGNQEAEDLRRHIPGCGFISTAAADDRAKKALGEGSFLYKWRGLDASYRR